MAPGVAPVVGLATVFELAAGVARAGGVDRESAARTSPSFACHARRATLDDGELRGGGRRIADPGNLGTILRSAEAAGADVVVLTPGTVDPFNPKVVRA